MTKTIQITCKGSSTAKIDDLLPFQGDLKSLSEQNYTKLSKSILSYGFSAPVFIWRNGSDYILDGHQRLKALNKLLSEGHKLETDDIPVVEITADNKKQAKEKLLAFASQYGYIDNKSLDDYITEADLDFEEIVSKMDFPNVDLDIKEEAEVIEDEVPDLPDEPKTKLGDIYILGNHRLMCGDSTKEDDVKTLMDGKKADLIVTDPPYGVGYVGKTKDALVIENDGSVDETKLIWSKAFLNYYKYSKDGASYYSFSCQGGDQMMMMMMIVAENWMVKHQLMWVKDNFVFSRCDYKYQHEPIIYGWKNGKTHQFYGDFKQSSVLNYDRPKRSESHPTMKPINLLAHLVKNSSKMGDLVLDLFLGSGSTMLACEQLNRECYGMELDPKYCDVIVERWENFTGKKATLVNNSKKVVTV